MNTKQFAVLVAAVAVVGCADSVVAPVPQTAIVGFWSLTPPAGQPPGFSTTVDLSLNNGTLTGNGGWSGEAGPFGTLSATGVMIADSVHLDLTFTKDTLFGGGFAFHATFSGRLTSEFDLVGRLAYDGQPAYDQAFKKFFPPALLNVPIR